MPNSDQPSLLTRIISLSKSIFEYQSKFDSGEYKTYGGAQALQGLKEQRSKLQGELDPIRLIATGISCRDCIWFSDVDTPTCWADDLPLPTTYCRSEGHCGPEARTFERIVERSAHA